MQFDQTMVLALAAAIAIGGALGALIIHVVLFAPRLRRLSAYVESLLTAPASASNRALGSGHLETALQRVSARMAAVETMATTDQLTGVLNRQASLRRLAMELERVHRYDGPITVGLADIDHFKKVNDTYGHAAGDIVLRHVAQLIRDNLRASDTIGRYGGEEFLLILPAIDVDSAGDAAEKLRRLVGRTPVTLPDGEELTVTISIGIAAGSGQGLRLDGITRDADSALYAAKSLGRDQVYLFKELDDERTIHRSPLTSAARDEAMAVGRMAAAAAEEHLAEILSPRPGWAGRPSQLIADLAVGLAAAVGLPDGEIRRIRTASLLHDVGKIAISEELLSKPSELSSTEWRSVMEHPKVGQIVLEQAGAMRDAATIALHHHEWFNGRGYPHGLAGADIPVGARIVAIADAYEAMTSQRPYQRTKTHDQALAELRRCAGTQFDPQLVDVFVMQFVDEPARVSDAPVRDLRTGTSG